MGNVTAIPEGKGTPAEVEEFEAFKNGDKNLRHEGIKPLKGEGYDPAAGLAKAKNVRPEPSYGPLLVTDEGQPKGITAKGINRESAKPLDKSEHGVVNSRGTGRKAQPTS